MKHIDLFSGIGGFSLAVDNVWYEQKNEHIFCELDSFCQAVLKKHWPDAYIYSDIRTITADSNWERHFHGEPKEQSTKRPLKAQCEPITSTRSSAIQIDLLTGGFPCQPFSQAGRRKGTADDRYLWPEMFRVISLFKPRWVIAENVAGLASWNEGMVLEQVCTDLEKEGYEVQPFVIPAVSVNAPHRRDRIWIVAHSNRKRLEGRTVPKLYNKDRKTRSILKKIGYEDRRHDWSKNWLEVATRLCRVDDGVPRRMDRNPRLKALGNAIVPQVAEEIMRSIYEANK